MSEKLDNRNRSLADFDFARPRVIKELRQRAANARRISNMLWVVGCMGVLASAVLAIVLMILNANDVPIFKITFLLAGSASIILGWMLSLSASFVIASIAERSEREAFLLEEEHARLISQA